MDLLARRGANTVLRGAKGATINKGYNWEDTRLHNANRNHQALRRSRSRTGANGVGVGQRQTRKVTKMPVAVPRVPYRTPQEGNWQWVDLWNCLYRERIIFVGQGITAELGNQLVGTLLYLDSVSQKDLQMYINTCEGGQLVPSLALYDTMRHLKSDIVTVGFGGVMGMAAFLMASGTKGKRLSLSHTRQLYRHVERDAGAPAHSRVHAQVPRDADREDPGAASGGLFEEQVLHARGRRGVRTH